MEFANSSPGCFNAGALRVPKRRRRARWAGVPKRRRRGRWAGVPKRRRRARWAGVPKRRRRARWAGVPKRRRRARWAGVPKRRRRGRWAGVLSAAGAVNGSQGQEGAQRARCPWSTDKKRASPGGATDTLARFCRPSRPVLLFRTFQGLRACGAHPWLPSAAPAAL
jgi:hypothetical protein